jgi:hypothetical protein
VHQRPIGLITITDMLGNEVGEVRVNDSSGAVLPQTERAFEVTWTDDGFHIGRYNAKASIVFGDVGRQTVTRDVVFWMLPAKELGIALALLLATVCYALYV